jgi:hypothetical protein
MTSSKMHALIGAALSLALVASATPALARETAVVAHSTAAPSAGETTWTIEPASVGAPDGRVSLRHEIEPGGSAVDEVTVTNFSATPATFAVYASDGVLSAEGGFDLLPPGEEPVDGGSWITITPVDGAVPREGGGLIVTLEPQATVAMPLTIEIPDDATPGDHPAGIVAELVPEDAGSVELASRVGVRVHLRVAGDIVSALGPEAISATWMPSWNPFAPGTVEVTYAIANEGNVRLGAETDVAVAGAFGVAGAEATGEVREVLPGQRSTATVELEVWPVFFGWGEVSVTPVVVGEDEVPPTPATAAPFTVWTIPWAQLCLLALLVFGFLLIRMVRRRSAAKVQARIDAAVAEAREQPEAETPVAEPSAVR